MLVFGDGIVIGLRFRVTQLRIGERGLRWFEMLNLLGGNRFNPTRVKTDNSTSKYSFAEISIRELGFQKFFLFFWGTFLTFSFISVWWCPLPVFLSTCNSFFKCSNTFLILQFCFFSYFSSTPFYYEHSAFFNAKFYFCIVIFILIVCIRVSSSLFLLANVLISFIIIIIITIIVIIIIIAVDVFL